MTPEQLARLPAVLFEIGKAIGSDEDLGLLLSRISQQVCALLDCDACSVMLLDVERRQLLTKAAHGLRSERLQRLSFRVGEGVAGWVIQHGEAALIEDVTVDPRFKVLEDARNSQARATPILSLACVPLFARGDRVGVLTATAGRRGAFGLHHLELLRFLATTIALDIENIRLHRVSVTDGLTGAYNREFLQQRLPLELEIARQRGVALAVAMVDVDHFKSINDRFGHDAGDRVLAEAARRLRGAIRGDDLLVRYGGEEFLVVLPGTDGTRAWEVGERMRAKLARQAIAIGGGRRAGGDATVELVEVRISIGIAEWRGSGEGEGAENAAGLIRRADKALYAAKGKGRNRVEVAA